MSMPRRRRNEVIVNFILDKSGSMESCKEEVITGFNAYIDELRDSAHDVGDDVSVTLTLFSNKARVLYAAKPLSDVEYLTEKTYTPSGWTALNDAIANTIGAVKHSFGRRRKNLPKVLFVIMTDGRENSSEVFRGEKGRIAVAQMIRECESEGNYTFVYLGANHDAFAAGRSLSIPTNNIEAYTVSNVGETMNRLSIGTRSYREADYLSSENFWNRQDSATRRPITNETIRQRVERTTNR